MQNNNLEQPLLPFGHSLLPTYPLPIYQWFGYKRPIKSTPAPMLKTLARTTVTGLSALAMLALAACAGMQEMEKRHAHWDYPPFGADDIALRNAFTQSCKQFERKPSGKRLHKNAMFGTYGQWQEICNTALNGTPAHTANYLQTALEKVKLPGPGKFTGYYKPVINGSLVRTEKYKVPLLARPDDLVIRNGVTGQLKTDGTFVSPYPNRAEISENLGNYKVILWLEDDVDAYFLHIQGSGAVELPDGSLRHIGFAGKNGHPYVAIGKVLKDMGEIEAPITAPKIRAWLKANPTRANEVLYANPSFIFFYLTESDSPGAMGAKLTAGRTLAVDTAHIPLGVPLWINTTLTHRNESFSRMMFAQDIGSAIKGASRGDIYLGQGDAAGEVAGDQNSTGSLYAYVPRQNLASR